MESNYRIAVAKGWQDVKAKDPHDITSRLTATYDDEKRQFTVSFLGIPYLLDCDSERIVCSSDGQTPDVMAQIIILNYLSFSTGVHRPCGQWVSLKEVPGGGALFYPAFLKQTIGALIDLFGQQPQKLLQAAALLGGKPAKMGSASVVFDVFPEIPLCIVVWEGDEEVRANATVLYDPDTTPLLHIETVIGVGMYVVDQLKKLG